MAPVDAGDWRRLANLQAIHGLALARLGRADEGRSPAAEALRTHRRLASRKHDDATHAFELAMAVHAAGAAGVLDPRAAYDEALELIDRLPPDIRGRRYTTMMR
jgi:hypothetical protein